MSRPGVAQGLHGGRAQVGAGTINTTTNPNTHTAAYSSSTSSSTATTTTPAASTATAALHGATRAFQRPQRSPSPLPSPSPRPSPLSLPLSSPSTPKTVDERVSGVDRHHLSNQHHGGALAAASQAASQAARTRPRSPASASFAVNNAVVAARRTSMSTEASLGSPTHSSPAHHPLPHSDPSLTAGRSAVARANITPLKASPLPSPNPPFAHENTRSRDQSPSHIAATLAAARAPNSAASNASSLPSSPMRADFARPLASPGRSSEDEVDRSNISTTRQLVRSFEANNGGAEDAVQLSLGSRTRSPPRAIISPVPLRPSIPLLASRKAIETLKPAVEAQRSPPVPPKKPVALARRDTQPSEPEDAPRVSRQRSRRKSLKKDGRTLEELQGQTTGRRRSDYEADDHSDTSSEASFASANERLSRSNTQKSDVQAIVKSQPKSPLPSPPMRKLQSIKPPPLSPPQRIIPPRRPSSPAVTYAMPDAPPLKPQLTADSLADAIVASSIAGSRVASPSRPVLATPPPPRPWSSMGRWGSRDHLSAYNVHNNTYSGSSPAVPLISRTPSPLKAMRRTLRAEPSPAPSSGVASSDEHTLPHQHHYHRHRLVRKHPHKHAEGDRQRWRDVVAEAERRRYEGVWAANRGILMISVSSADNAKATTDGAADASDADAAIEDSVHGYVVRDIWTRSGLNTPTLAQVWDLVAAGGRLGNAARSLRRDEFVVGLWLVDQCLKGRRLPVEVGESVWTSVRGLMPGLRGR